MIHVYPTDSEVPHEDCTSCWCGPRVEWEDPDTGETYAEGLVIHDDDDELMAKRMVQLIRFYFGGVDNTDT